VIQLQERVAAKLPFEESPFAITLVTYDLATSIEFYEHKLGLTKVFGDDVGAIYRSGKTLINLLIAVASVELIEPAKVAGANSGVAAVYTLRVSDADAEVAKLKAAALKLKMPIDRPWGVRTASLKTRAVTPGTRRPRLIRSAWVNETLKRNSTTSPSRMT
jgi:catechol 2,3-dioxygenase-like lactoylglutathione lyase family enzyme